SWLAVVWLLVFVAIALAHFRYLLARPGQRRAWHAAHVLMAVGMAFMYAQSAGGALSDPSGFWRATFTYAAGATGAWVLVQLLYRHAVNVLWPLIALDLAAMVYMWSPSGMTAAITAPIVCYFALQAGLWSLSTYRRLSLRPSMIAMTLGMGYMLTAMQLA
ncbi:MAG: hypothetical protein ACYDHH_26125, partial [Solirubrobacteraceae bacterium]